MAGDGNLYVSDTFELSYGNALDLFQPARRRICRRARCLRPFDVLDAHSGHELISTEAGRCPQLGRPVPEVVLAALHRELPARVINRRHAAALLLVVSFLVVPFAASHAYVGQNPYVVHLDGPSGIVRCDSSAVITATVRNAETGEVVAGQEVIWDVKVPRSPGDSVSPTRSVTNDRGKTSTTLRFGAAEGERTVRATIATWPATIDVTCQGGVPTPSPMPPPTPSPSATPTATPTASPTEPSTPTPTPPPNLVTPTATLLQPTGPGETGVPSTTPGLSESPTPSPTSTTPRSTLVGASTAPPASPATQAPGEPPGSVIVPTSPDMALLAALALIGLGLAALGFVFVRHK